MNHDDHVRLIRAGVEGAGPRWLELGAGEGAFTLALADLLGQDRTIVAVDRDARALATLDDRLTRWYPATAVQVVVGDVRERLPAGPFDGLLAANSLNFLTDPVAALRAAAALLAPGGRVVVVEYDADRGNAWVPHPFSAARFPAIAREAGLTGPREIGRIPSRFLGAIYAAVATRPEGSDADDPVLHSAPHGNDREE